MTIDGWPKSLLETLVYRGGGVNSSGFRVISAWTRSNSFRRYFWGCVGMERPNDAVDGKHIGI